MTQFSRSRWLLVPVWFAALLFLSLIVRWWPAASARAHDAYGVGTVIAGDIFLAWKSLIRGAAALVLTLLAWSLLPPLKKTEPVVIAAAVVLAEVAVELGTAALLGVNASVWYQILATCFAYLTIGTMSTSLLRHRVSVHMAL
jgi:hypothetical protein